MIEAAAERAEERAAKRRRRTRGQPARAVPVPGTWASVGSFFGYGGHGVCVFLAVGV